MSEEIVKLDVNNAFSENACDLKREFQDEYYPDNKICISETTVSISKTELNEYMRNDEIRKYEMLSVDHIKIDLSSSEVKDTVNNNVKIESGICSADIQIEFCNELAFCKYCHEVYQDYCTKCRMLVHILNKRPSHNTYNRVRELPKYMLEARESLENLGIFALNIIPENVRFGPFTGFHCTGLPLKIKHGRLIVSDDQLEHLNWLQYINPARNIYEQNLFPFQYEDKLYYCSTRRIQEGEELMVYFGEEYIENMFKNVEMDFVPIIKKDVENVFACTFCCLGFSLKEYLIEHKAMCQNEINEMFSVEELIQCPFCKIYLDAKEYMEYHMDYCSKTNVRLPSLEVHMLEVERRSSVRSKAKMWKRRMYKCTQCKFRTMYNADFRHHTNEHYKVKMYKCEICGRRYKTRKSLKTHVEKIHVVNEGRNNEKYFTCDYFKANIKNMKERCPNSPNVGKKCKFSKCKSQTRNKRSLKSLTKRKHLKQKDLKDTPCEFKTSKKSDLQVHVKPKHLGQSDYNCTECEYQTNSKSNIELHFITKHLKQRYYKCAQCEYQTNFKPSLKMHIKTKHLNPRDYKCEECEYQTNYKSSLEYHLKAKHPKQNYKCTACKYKTNNKKTLKIHLKAEHPKQWDYKCTECEFKTNYRPSLKRHVTAKHLNKIDYKCAACKYKTNNKKTLKIHLKAEHTKQWDYKCTECEFKTNHRPSLKGHVTAKHLKKIGYKCAACEYQTNSKSNIEGHIKTKHLNQNYKCAVSIQDNHENVFTSS